MVNHLLHGQDTRSPRSLWVTDFSNPDELVPAEHAFYLVSPTLASPMGLGLTAFARAQDRDGAKHAFGGEAVDWDGVRALVSSAWPDGRPPMRHGGHTASIPPVGTHPGM
jgi:nitrous oxide reductase accessory protein NosL